MVRRPALNALMLFVVSVLALTVGAGSAGATPSKYEFHAGDGFGPISSSDVAEASDGSTIAISATGNFHVASHKASGSGTFVHKDVDGTMDSGTFTVTRLASFDPFGCDVENADVCGGFAVLAIHVVRHPPEGGTQEFPAVLTIDCLIGNPPPGAEEGITFEVPGRVDFDHPVSGNAVFVQK